MQLHWVDKAPSTPYTLQNLPERPKDTAKWRIPNERSKDLMAYRELRTPGIQEQALDCSAT